MTGCVDVHGTTRRAVRCVGDACVILLVLREYDARVTRDIWLGWDGMFVDGAERRGVRLDVVVVVHG